MNQEILNNGLIGGTRKKTIPPELYDIQEMLERCSQQIGDVRLNVADLLRGEESYRSPYVQHICCAMRALQVASNYMYKAIDHYNEALTEFIASPFI